MKDACIVTILICLTATANVTFADTIRGIDMEFVNIGHAGNAPDTRVMTNDGTTGYGSVAYEYRIGKYEVTNAQWNAFVSIAGAPTGTPYYAYDESAYWTGSKQPINMVSWYEAAQFCNYLTSGNKNLGAYQLDTNGSITVNRLSAISAYGMVYVLPTLDEWYKAAYYKSDGSGYSLYANGKNIIPYSGIQSNYNDYPNGSPWNVGTGTQEQNGTYDMMGNVVEWNESLLFSPYRSLRGGTYDGSGFWLASSSQNNCAPSHEHYSLGFRIASVPEPACAIIMFLGAVWMGAKRKR